MAIAAKEIQETLANFSTCKFHLNGHLILHYLKTGESSFFSLILFGSAEERALPFCYRYRTSHQPYSMDKYIQYVVKLHRIKTQRIIITP